MKKILTLLIILLLTGCSNYHEMSDLGIITSLAIDYKDNKFNICAGMLNFKDNKESTIVINSSNDTIYTSINDLSLTSSKHIYLEHLMVLVLSEEVYKNHLENVIDFFKSYVETPLSFYVITTKDAKKVIEISSPFDSSTSNYLSQSLEVNSKTNGNSTIVTFDELLDSFYSSSNPVLTNIEIKDDKLININNLTTLNKNNELYNLSYEESIAYNLIKNNIDNTILKIDCDQSYFTVNLKWNKTNIKIKDNNSFNFNFKTYGTVEEYNCSLKDEKKIHDYVSSKTKDKIYDILSLTINNSKKYNSDYLEFGKYLYAYKHKYFKENKDYLDKINTSINIDLTIDRVNNINKEGSEYYKQ